MLDIIYIWKIEFPAFKTCLLCVLATAPGQVEELFGKRKSSIRRSARATLGRNHNDSKGTFGERHLGDNVRPANDTWATTFVRRKTLGRQRSSGERHLADNVLLTRYSHVTLFTFTSV